MSDISSSGGKKLMEQLNEDLSNVMNRLSVTTDNSIKKSPSLSDMPIDVVGLIIEKSNYRQQLKLRKVSKSLRALVDKQKPACKTIRIVCCMHNINITFNNHFVMYTDAIGDSEDYDNDVITTVASDDFKKSAFDDLTSILKNPKLQLEELTVCFHYATDQDIEEYRNEMRNGLDCLNHKLSVKKFASDLPFPSCLLFILPYLKPGVLEIISLDLRELQYEFNWSINSIEMDQVALLNQWKQAEELHLLYAFDWFPKKYATHFKRFLIEELSIDRDKFIRIRDFLSKLDNFEQCTFVCKNCARFLGKPVSSNTTEAVHNYMIPDSDYFLQFRIPANSPDDVEITKKKK